MREGGREGKRGRDACSLHRELHITLVNTSNNGRLGMYV